MACFSPLKAFQIGYNIETKKPIYKICNFSVQAVYITAHDIAKVTDNPKKIRKNKNYKRLITTYIEIPCGKCIGCRLDYAQSWANRCMLESKYHEESYFLTLTYDDEHVPKTSYVDVETGEIKETSTLVKDHYQAFMKALRQKYAKKYDNRLRFYMCGEYGSHTYRPHYHIICFGLKLDDLKLYSRTPEGNSLYNSEFVSSCWSYGYVVIGEVNYETCSYTARYVMKKAMADSKDLFELMNMQPEFNAMSRHPGIGRQYYDDHPELFDSEYIHLATEKGGIKFKPPRYFVRIKDQEDHKFIKKRKGKGIELSKATKLAKMEDSSLCYLDLLQVEKEVKESQIKSLKRRLK